MNPAAKRFLIIYAVVYMVVAILINVIWGPPGLSKDYRDQFKEDHESYLNIVKSDPYKLWKENEALHPPTETNKKDFDIAEAFQATDTFKAEAFRRKLYQRSFDFWTFIMIILLAVRFGKAPAIAFIDNSIDEVRRRIQRAEDARNTAAGRRSAAQAKLDGLDGERSAIATETQGRIERERARIEESTARALALLKVETGDRVHQEELRAEALMKRELVDHAIGLITEGYKAQGSAEQESALIDQFLEQLEKGQ